MPLAWEVIFIPVPLVTAEPLPSHVTVAAEQVNVRHAPSKIKKAYRLRYAFFFSYFGIEELYSGVICLLTPFSCSIPGQDSNDQHQEHANGIEVYKRDGCRRHCKVISELS